MQQLCHFRTSLNWYYLDKNVKTVIFALGIYWTSKPHSWGVMLYRFSSWHFQLRILNLSNRMNEASRIEHNCCYRIQSTRIFFAGKKLHSKHAQTHSEIVLWNVRLPLNTIQCENIFMRSSSRMRSVYRALLHSASFKNAKYTYLSTNDVTT